MSLSATLTPNGRIFAGNPLKLEVNSDSLCRYIVTVGDEDVFTGSGEGSFFVYLNNVIEPYIHSKVFYNNDPYDLIPVNDVLKNCTVTISNDTDSPIVKSFIAHPGGISRSCFRHLGNTSIFTSRFITDDSSHDVNLFFTLRGEDSLVLIKETEISPLLFVYPTSGTLSIVCNNVTIPLSGTAGQPYALNIDRIRRSLFAFNGFIGSYFELKNGVNILARIGITSVDFSKDRYLVRFLNSFGSYEIVECIGSAKRMNSDEHDDESFDVFDEIVDGYVRQRNRGMKRLKLSINTGSLTESSLLFYQDMLASDDVTLLGYHGADVKVIPSSPDLTFIHNSEKSQSFSIDFLFADCDDRFTFDDIGSQFGDGRIHTSQFTDHFN